MRQARERLTTINEFEEKRKGSLDKKICWKEEGCCGEVEKTLLIWTISCSNKWAPNALSSSTNWRSSCISDASRHDVSIISLMLTHDELLSNTMT